MPIASIGAVVRVTPGDELQIVRGKGDNEFVDDRTPFRVRVSEVLREEGVVIGITGPVIEGHPRYQGLVATLLTRIDGSRWESEIHSGVNFKIGRSVAHRVAGFPHYHPEGMEIDEYPYILRYGSIDLDG